MAKTKVVTIPASTDTTRPAMLFVNGRPISGGDAILQVVLKTSSSNPEEPPAKTDYQFKEDDLTEILALKVVDVVTAGGYPGSLADITVLDLLEYLSLGILFDRGVEDPADWT